MSNCGNLKYIRKPDWLKIKLPDLREATKVISLLEQYHLNTICSSGMCPNRGECWGHGTATFMIGGDVCTRACKFCAVKTGNPMGKINHKEIDDILKSINVLKLKHVVLTSVDRDDLPDGGASHWAQTVRAIKISFPSVTIETLIPDFQGNKSHIDMIIRENPDVISHNLETVERLTPVIRSVATYQRSLNILRHISLSGIRTKSGIMLGLGETHNDVLKTMDDLLGTGCSIMTIGQYLQPTQKQVPVKEYVSPERFEGYRHEGLKRGFKFVESSPFVRSSYHAERHASPVNK